MRDQEKPQNQEKPLRSPSSQTQGKQKQPKTYPSTYRVEPWQKAAEPEPTLAPSVKKTDRRGVLKGILNHGQEFNEKPEPQ